MYYSKCIIANVLQQMQYRKSVILNVLQEMYESKCSLANVVQKMLYKMYYSKYIITNVLQQMQYRKCSIVNDTASCTCVVSHVQNNVRLLFPLSPILLKHINFSIIDKIFLKFLFSDKYIGLTVIIFQSCLTKQTFKPLKKFKCQNKSSDALRK